MKQITSIPAMIALAGVLAVPAIVAAQPATPATAKPAAATPVTPMAGTTPGAAVTTPRVTVVTNAETSAYLTADQHVRSSKLVGASVYNAQNDKIGSVDDMLIDAKGDISGVVLSVGGFLGIDAKLVEVPYNQLEVHGNRLQIAGATKAQLTQLPEYKYASNT